MAAKVIKKWQNVITSATFFLFFIHSRAFVSFSKATSTSEKTNDDGSSSVRVVALLSLSGE